MPVSFLDNSYFTSPLVPTLKPQRSSLPVVGRRVAVCCSRGSGEDDCSLRRSENQLVKLALVAMTAGVLTVGSVDPAAAAKTGGRIGGQAFRPSAPRSSGPRINNSRTNVFINPQVAPPLVGGYGYGFGPFYGGWGWSPFSFFAPGPSVTVGVGGGFDLFLLLFIVGTVSTIVRRFFRLREDDDDY